MRIMIALLLTIFSVRAETLNFICEPADYVFMHKFFAQGTMVIEPNYAKDAQEDESILSNTKAIISFRLAKGGEQTEYSDYVGQMLEGDTKYIASMTKAPYMFTQFILNETESHFDIKFLFDYSEKFDSRIRDIFSGYVYRANCRITK